MKKNFFYFFLNSSPSNNFIIILFLKMSLLPEFLDNYTSSSTSSKITHAYIHYYEFENEYIVAYLANPYTDENFAHFLKKINDFKSPQYLAGYIWFDDGSWAEGELVSKDDYKYYSTDKDYQSLNSWSILWFHRVRPQVPTCLINNVNDTIESICSELTKLKLKCDGIDPNLYSNLVRIKDIVRDMQEES